MSQFRQDPISLDWVLIAPERGGKRPHDFSGVKKRTPAPKSACPFEDLIATGNWPPITEYVEKGKWQMVVIPNKFPALRHEAACPTEINVGPYASIEGIGHHELIVTRDHRDSFADLSPERAFRVFQLFAERYRSIDGDHCMAYLVGFGNWGPLAGASLTHPHYQLIATPIIPPHVARSLEGSRRHFLKEKRCAHCDVVAFERKKKERVIAETQEAVAIAPFASGGAYQIKIFPKRHSAFFEDAPEASMKGVAAMLQKTLQRFKVKLGDPDYNFYIHSGPLKDRRRYASYHWHIEVVPKLATLGGLEFATGVNINIVAPEVAAKKLR